MVSPRILTNSTGGIIYKLSSALHFSLRLITGRTHQTHVHTHIQASAVIHICCLLERAMLHLLCHLPPPQYLSQFIPPPTALSFNALPSLYITQPSRCHTSLSTLLREKKKAEKTKQKK